MEKLTLTVAIIILILGCSRASMENDALEASHGICRTSRPGFSNYDMTALGFSVQNNRNKIIRCIKIVYEIKVPERWQGPGSVPPREWVPKEVWRIGGRIYVNCVLPPGESLTLMDTTDWAISYRVISVTLEATPYSDPEDPLLLMAIEQVVPGGSSGDLSVLIKWQEIAEAHKAIRTNIEKNDPLHLNAIYEKQEHWDEVVISPSINEVALKSFLLESDAENRGIDKYTWKQITKAD